jgi:chromatin remodeling complex protein RSC6
MAIVAEKSSSIKQSSTPLKAVEKPIVMAVDGNVVADKSDSVTEKVSLDTDTVHETVSGAVAVVEEENNPVSVYVSKLNNYVDRISSMNKELKELVNVGKSLEKDFNNIVKVMSKKNKKTSSEKRHPSGFAVPYKLSDELYDFLNINKGEKVPRNDVTRMINEYIKTNELRDTKDKRIIIPNTELHKIFNSTSSDSITYFNLQSYIKHHFIKEKI